MSNVRVEGEQSKCFSSLGPAGSWVTTMEERGDFHTRQIPFPPDSNTLKRAHQETSQHLQCLPSAHPLPYTCLLPLPKPSSHSLAPRSPSGLTCSLRILRGLLTFLHMTGYFLMTLNHSLNALFSQSQSDFLTETTSPT